MYPLLRLAGFTFSFVIIATVLCAQLSARPTVSISQQVEQAQAVLAKSQRARVGRLLELRRLPRPVAGTLA
jgi:hypothetical protein